ncbi:MAG: zinc-ribbon domain-containing protein [Candidatus Marinimicrobia bacterium]|nr:zinc-ribbon domain-containing protein [Candidatus Neomarinimicrobiota bacterium]
MIVKCPSCAARFRLDRKKLAGKRVTMRCARCRNPFKVELPHGPRVQVSKKTRVMIAHSDSELSSTIKKIVEDAGFEALLGHDGAEVLAVMEAVRPKIAVVDVALQGLYAFEVVDKVRRRPGLADVKVILLSSVYNKAAYKRAPTSLYGADDYIEKHHIPDDLVLKINRLLAGAVPAPGPTADGEVEKSGERLTPAEGTSQSLDFINAVNEKIQTAEDREISADDVPERDRAERLARVIVSDISLYYQDRIAEGIVEGNWSELLATEIKEARRLFRERFPSQTIQNSKILEAAFLDLLEKRRRELGD